MRISTGFLLLNVVIAKGLISRISKPRTLSSQEKQIIGEKEISNKAKDGSYDAGGNSWQPGRPEKVIDRKSHQGTAAETIGRKRTKRTTDSIVLYMPPNLQVNHNAVYKQNEMGGMGMETGQRIASMVSRAQALGGGWSGALDAAIEALPGFGQQAGREALRVGAKIGAEIIEKIYRESN